MGKGDNQRLPIVQQSNGSGGGDSRYFLCQRCSMSICTLFNFKCAVVLIFSVAVFLSAVFWILPLHYRHVGFDAKDSIKLSASVQAHFKLQKPVSDLVPYIERLEYDVNGEIGVPSLKVAVLSMHPAKLANWTDVVFGFLPDPINSSIIPVYLSVLRSSLIDLFLQQSNLTLTSSIFGEPSSFEILKFPDGITIIPERAALILHIPQVLFNFTLNSTINDIKENLPQLKEQLKSELHLMPNEVLYIQVTNKDGSTKFPPVTVEASVASDLGTLLPERLRQLAQIITASPPTENLGLDHSVFGKVKEISLSSFLNHSLNSPTPTPCASPAPSPEQLYDSGPSTAPSYSPSLSPNSHHSQSPCFNGYSSAPSWPSQPCAPSPQEVPQHSLSPTSNSPAPSIAQFTPHCGSTDPPSPSPITHRDKTFPIGSPRASTESPLAGSSHQIPPSPSPLPIIAYGSPGLNERSRNGLVSPPHVSSSSASCGSSCNWEIPWFYLIGVLTFLLFK
ncbi:hypothetical protein ACJIZ3_015742 [Penstemon smallii]|uniref:DUF7036 domain-containing protein n=1 Tax=Penstemon smallii TaxID=265156 RepID=A0ABD3RND8_9LAMI